jgi:solute carrier family 66 (lysosomal lysine-arginine transporter), member 1
MLSTLGNITYGASILFHSLEKEYITTNLPWLIGSLGTIAEDVVIFIQFRMYKTKPDSSSAIEE